MRCPACGVLIHDTDDYCRRCGARVAGQGNDLPSEIGDRRQRTPGARLGRDDEPEEVLWEGTYSLIAMFREFFVALLLSLILPLVVSAAAEPQRQAWSIPVVAVIWGLFACLVIYRRLDVWYRVSNQRLFHEDGILYRRINRIEIIDIDDLRCEQGLLERLLGVGRIVVRSSDPTHPVLVMRGLKQVRYVFELIDAARRERLRHGLHIEAI